MSLRYSVATFSRESSTIKARFLARELPKRANWLACPADRTPTSPLPSSTLLMPETSENIASISWITSNKSGGILGAMRSTFALGISEAKSPPGRFNAKFFSSKMPIKPDRAVGGLTCLLSNSRISDIR